MNPGPEALALEDGLKKQHLILEAVYRYVQRGVSAPDSYYRLRQDIAYILAGLEPPMPIQLEKEGD